MKKTFDAVAMQRRIRRSLTRRYSKHPELEEQELQEIRQKYGFPEPRRQLKTQLVAEGQGKYESGKQRGK
jgi:hypothetical protein